MISRFIRLPVVIAAMALCGTGMQLLHPLVGQNYESGVHTEHYGTTTTLRSASAGVLGGFRGLAGDLLWLRAYVAWEDQDAALTEALVRLTTVIDGRPLAFWLDGARIIAYDIPAWSVDASSTVQAPPGLPNSRADYARRAIALLDDGMNIHPTSAELWMERAGIELRVLKDVAAAAESYRRASLMPAAPFQAARLHAEMLRRLDRDPMH